MSHHTVGIAIDALLTNEDLRTRFAIDPIKTLADLNVRGCALTPDEIDIFVRTDARLWFLHDDLTRGPVH